MTKTSKAQIKAVNNWNGQNKDRHTYYSNKSAAKRFINKLATQDDLVELKKLIDDRLKGDCKN